MSTQFTNRQWRLPNNENKDKQSNYSMKFDGSGYISLGDDVPPFNQTTSKFSISFWLYNTAYPNEGLKCIFENRVNYAGGASYNSGISFESTSTATFRLFMYPPSSSYNYVTFPQTELNEDEWNHIAIVFDGTESNYQDRIEIYVNNSPVTLNYPSSNVPTQIAGASAGDEFRIAKGAQPNFTGQMDAFSIFNYALSASQITTLYGSSSTGIGNPMSLSPKPVAFYQLGDKSAFNSANYLVPNIAAQEDDGDIAVSYSPYALDFDGTDDYIAASVSALNSASQCTISFWGKKDASNKTINVGGLITNNEGIWLMWYSDGNIYFSPRGSSATGFALTHSQSYDSNWHHYVGVYDGSSASNCKLYLDGSLVATGSGTPPSSLPATTGDVFKIGALTASSIYSDGSISNCSIWNAGLTSAQVTEIYNEGVPSNLNNHSAYSNLVSWWQLGSNSSFNTNWTVLDEKGSNNGASVNMTEVDIVDGVGSYANGLSSGMGGDEVIGDAPYSSSNSLSVNMDVEDRTTDTPS